MKETPQQYTKRILKNQQGKDPVSVLSSTPAKIAKLLRGVSGSDSRRVLRQENGQSRKFWLTWRMLNWSQDFGCG